MTEGRDDFEEETWASDDSPPELRFELGDEYAGQRADAVLSVVAEVPRAQTRRWLESGCAWLNGETIRPSRKVAPGDVLTARPPDATPMTAAPEALPLDVLYEDADLIVVDKAAGMVVHPAPGHASGTLVNALLHHCEDLAGIGGVLRPGIVHRLDRGTSGVMVAAKNDDAHRDLARQFFEHSIERVYLAFVRALPGADAGEIDRPIGRHPRDRKRMSVRTESGREALSRWRVAARYPSSGVSRLEVRPETGRTHQIRVHLSSQGMPLVGDPVYGLSRGRARGRSHGRTLRTPLDRPALHAALLAFIHPRTDERMRFEAPLPADLAALERELNDAEESG